MVAVETNKGTAALSVCTSASRAAYSCSQINSGDVGMTGRAPLGEAEWGQDRSMEAHWKGLAWEETLENNE